MNGTSVAQDIKGSWGWLLTLGIIYVIMGFFIIGMPGAATLALELLLGIVLIVGGIISVGGSFLAGDWKRFLFIFLSGVLYIIVGVLLLKNPIAGVLTLTLLLAAFLLVEGFFKIIHAFQLRPLPSWIWLFVSGAASVILGIMVWAGFPETSTFILGLLVGIAFLMNGLSMVMVAFALKGK
ncbi:MAG TPA: DUF308 domain-containing protein [Thermodesulfobacteriota bacterium]|nr:DUF308 domain-containing protein [Thermodesulfobacteriota bacterium]